MKIQEASEDITRRKNYVSSPKTSYMEENTQKTKKQVITRGSLGCTKMQSLVWTRRHRMRKNAHMRPQV